MNPSRDEIIALLKFADVRCDRTSPVFQVFIPLASAPPVRRLTGNLSEMLALTETSEIGDILADGLTGVEKKALLELELHGASDDLLGVAHGLLNIHERWFLLKSVGRKFRDAATSHEEFARPSDVLANLLEETNGEA